MTTVVTGASGFLGGAVVRALLDKGQAVRAVDLARGPTLDELDVEFVTADVLDPVSLDRALKGAKTVIHLVAVISIAGDPTGKVWTTNVDGVRNVATSALHADVERMVHCSSVHAFDLESEGRPVDERSPRATSPGLPVYDRSKAAGEAELRKVIDQGLDAVVVNPTGIIGIYDYEPSRMGQVFKALFDRKLPGLIDASFDWVDSRDVAASVVAAVSSGRTGENYLLPGNCVNIKDLAQMTSEVSGTPPPRLTVPMWLAKKWGPVGERLNRRSGSALTFTTEAMHALEHSPTIIGAKAREELGHDPRPIEATIRDIHEWFEGDSLYYSSSASSS